MAGIVRGELDGRPIMLENAATEATLEALLQATLANSSNKSQAAKIQKAYEEALKKTTQSQDKNLDSMKKQKKAIEDENKERDSLTAKIKEEQAAREKMFMKMVEAGALLGKGIGSVFSTATPKISDFTGALSGIPIVGPIIGALGNAMQGQIDKFRELSAVGADFGVSIDAVRLIAKDSGLSLDDFTAAITSNSRDLALLGGNAAEGAKRFVAVSKSLQGPFRDGLSRLGFSMGEVGDLTAAYLAQQTRLGLAQRMTQDDLNKGAQDYLLELDRLARVTGMTRKEAQKELDAQLADKRFKALTMSLGSFGKELNSMMVSVAATDKDTAEGMKELMLTNGVPISDLGRSFKLMNPLLADAAVNFKNQKITGDQFAAALRASGKAATATLSSPMGATIGLYKALGVPLYDSTIGLTGFANFLEKASEAEQAKQEAMQKTQNDQLLLDTALLSLRNTLMSALLPTFAMLTGTITLMVPAIENFIGQIATIVSGEGGVKAALVFIVKEVGSILGSALSDMISGPAVAGAVIAGIGALWGFAAVKTALVKGIAEAMSGAKSKGPAPGQYSGWQSSAPEGPSSELPKKGGLGGKLFGLLKGGGLASLGGMGLEFAGEKVAEAGHTKTGAGLDIAGSTAKYAGLGAMAGSIIPGLGTVIGAGIGGTIGLGAGLYESGSKLFGKDKPATPAAAKTPTPQDKDMAKAAEVATIQTSAEVKAIAEALKTLDYGKLTVPEATIKSIDDGTNKLRFLRAEVNAMSESFKTLNNTGLDKITAGLNRLDESFKSFNKSFVEEFITKFKELDKQSQETLLTNLNDKMDQLNINASALVELTAENTKNGKNIVRNTQATSGRVY